MERLEEEVCEFQNELLRRMGFDLTVEEVESTDESIRIAMNGTDRDEVLQERAELLDALQYLLNRIFGPRLDGRRVVADCNDYRKQKETELRQIAQRVAQRVRLSGQKEALGAMNPHDRRIVHLEVAELEGVTTVSDGEGFLKRVTILPD